MIAAEDQRFADHNGFDMDAISSALKHNQQSRRVRGASTLSQQTAKISSCGAIAASLRKGIEAWFAAHLLLMELGWDKSRILEVYLNIVEFGPGIYGAEAAARHYFGKPSARLTRYRGLPCFCRRPAQPWRYRVKPPRPMCSSARPGSAARWVPARSGHPEPGTRGRARHRGHRAQGPRWPPTVSRCSGR